MFDDGVLIVALLFVFVFLLGFLAGALYLNGEYASGSYVYFNAATPITIRGASNKMIYVVWGGAAATAVLGFFVGLCLWRVLFPPMEHIGKLSKGDEEDGNSVGNKNC